MKVNHSMDNSPQENDAQILEALEKVKKSRDWLGKHHEEISAKYQGKVFAMEDEEVVESDENVLELLEKVKDKKRDTAFLIIEAVPQKGVAYIL